MIKHIYLRRNLEGRCLRFYEIKIDILKEHSAKVQLNSNIRFVENFIWELDSYQVKNLKELILCDDFKSLKEKYSKGTIGGSEQSFLNIIYTNDEKKEIFSNWSYYSDDFDVELIAKYAKIDANEYKLDASTEKELYIYYYTTHKIDQIIGIKHFMAILDHRCGYDEDDEKRQIDFKLSIEERKKILEPIEREDRKQDEKVMPEEIYIKREFDKEQGLYYELKIKKQRVYFRSNIQENVEFSWGLHDSIQIRKLKKLLINETIQKIESLSESNISEDRDEAFIKITYQENIIKKMSMNFIRNTDLLDDIVKDFGLYTFDKIEQIIGVKSCIAILSHH